MAQVSTTTSQGVKLYHPAVAWILILGSALVFFAVGVGIGKLFFWQNYNDAPFAERQLEAATKRVRSDGKNPANWVNLGWIYFQQGKYNQALANYKKAIDIDPNYFPAHYNLGLTYLQEKKYALAAETLKKAISIEPKNAGAHLNLGIAYNKLNKYEDAVKELEAAYKLQPGYVEVIYQIGYAYEKMGKIEEAKYQYNSALSFDPKFKKAQEALKRLKDK